LAIIQFEDDEGYNAKHIIALLHVSKRDIMLNGRTWTCDFH